MDAEREFYRWRPHPWHGLEAGPDPPRVVNAYIEITPFDLVKYELDKTTGYIRVDRPQRTSSLPPTLYGFIPRTYCGTRVGKLATRPKQGDQDPLDICVISERPITRGEVVLTARVLGGLETTDRGVADDKIIAVLVNDPFWGAAQDVADLPAAMVERMRHYFGTYKLIPGQPNQVRIEQVYGQARALEAVAAAMADYRDEYLDQLSPERPA